MMIPETVGELRMFLETYPDNLPILVQGNVETDPGTFPQRFAVEYWGEPSTNDPFLLLAVVNLDIIAPPNLSWKKLGDPNASWNLPK